MRRRSFLVTAGAAAISAIRKGAAQTPLGTLTWVEPGGLWTRELPDGRAAKIASGDGLREPRFSASGRWISYLSREGKVCVVRGDGKSGASFKAEAGVWLPAEDRLAIPQGHDVALFGPADGWKSPVARWKDAGLPVAGPDGQRYTAVRIHERPADAYGLNRDTAELYVASLTAADGKPQALIPNNEGGIRPYAWTRDEKSILYWRADEWSGSLWADGVELYSIAAAGGPERKLGISALAHDDVLDLAPESAGNRLAATRSRGRETWASQRIATVDLDTGAVRDLTPANVAALCPAWSPDGRGIVYFAAPDADAAYRKTMTGVNIRIMNPDGTVTTKVVTPDMNIGVGGGEEAHVFLQQRKIWLLDPSGANAPRQLTGDPHYRDEEPLWSADGSHILFGRMDYDGHASLWLMASDGAKAVRVCPLKIYDPPRDEDSWFGFYGYIDWRSAFDWRRS